MRHIKRIKSRRDPQYFEVLLFSVVSLQRVKKVKAAVKKVNLSSNIIFPELRQNYFSPDQKALSTLLLAVGPSPLPGSGALSEHQA